MPVLDDMQHDDYLEVRERKLLHRLKLDLHHSVTQLSLHTAHIAFIRVKSKGKVHIQGN